jgi:integrase
VHIKGAGAETTQERRSLSIDEVIRFAEAMPGRYRVMILVAAFGALRWSECLGLQRRDVDLDRPGVMLRRAIVQPTTVSRSSAC